ncbi:hypothetical protein H072_10827 [Dactylellina haptotyla CBS 200.50]|uniref:Uncharacterized protein n=1 Tax=Dactylellina haptotyla (strain CBS 200.50) TaxID=1284197 RepID=S7ZY72_DACHA|nr:hypothetical protein H072_10827 [Dactylellina haptotyla CBS 200.50]
MAAMRHDHRPTFLSEEDDAVLLKMPPHLAARFYKPKKPAQRRRSSSASSTGPGYIHPTERAYSRRQKFLESRKSRLAAKALHGEKVRSRVNQHGSHQALSQRLQALNESLAAAKEAREALLAKTAAACASEVAKAKAVAEEVRLKREDSIRAIKDGMADKLNAAEERRQELLKARQNRRPRGSSASLKTTTEINEVVEPLRKAARDGARSVSPPQRELTAEETRDGAARRIQRNWLAHRNAVVVTDFANRGFTIGSIQTMPFEIATATIQDAELVKATGNLLQLGGILEESDKAINITKACRTFLSAYLILGHPAEVLSNDGENEKTLITQSRDLLCAFESWISTANNYNGFRGTPTRRQALIDAYQPFSIAFNAWKERDQIELINGMINQFVELDALWQKVKDDSEPQVAIEFKESIQENQMMILSRMKAIGGKKATEMLRKAIARSRRKLLRKQADKKPRAVASGEETANAAPQSVDINTAMQQVEEGAKADEDSALSYQTAFEDDSRFKLTNRHLAHELLLNRSFRFKERSKNQIEQTVEYQAKKAFYDIMREDIAEGELEKWIPSMAETVRQKLLRLVPQGSSVHQMIANAIDIELIMQQCRAKTYDHVSFFTFLYSLLPKLCSPARDEACQELINDSSPEQDYISRLEKLIDFLELMQLDHANYQLMMAAPQIIPHAIQYEQLLFAEDLTAGRFDLSQTKNWLKPVVSERLAELAARDVENVNHPRQQPTVLSLLNQAYVSLVIHLNRLETIVVPETFHLDLERLLDLYKEVNTVVVSSAMLLTVKSLLRKDARTAWKGLKDKSVELTTTNNVSIDDKAEQIANFVKEDLVTTVTDAQLGHIKSAAKRLLGNFETAKTGDTSGLLADPVVKVMLSRLRGFVLARLNAQTPKDKVRLASSASETLTSFGMTEQVAEVGAIVETMLALAVVNRECYGKWYEEIVKKAIEENVN